MTQPNFRTTCYLLGHVDPDTCAITTVSLYSVSHMAITRNFNSHGLVEILHGEGEDYPAARRSVLSQLRQFEHTKSFAWISKLYEAQLRATGSKYDLQEWAAAAPQAIG